MPGKPLIASAYLIIACLAVACIVSDHLAAGDFGSLEQRRAALLGQRIPELQMRDCSFVEAMEMLSHASGATIVVDERLANARAPASSIRVRQLLFDVSLGQALASFVRQVPAAPPLAWRWRGDDIVISSAADVSNDTYVQAYDISDLVTVGDGDFGESATPGINGDVGPVSGLFAFSQSREELRETLRGLIVEMVARDTWVEGGGTSASLWVVDDTLLVIQSRQNHRDLADLLSRLRQTTPEE